MVWNGPLRIHTRRRLDVSQGSEFEFRRVARVVLVVSAEVLFVLWYPALGARTDVLAQLANGTPSLDQFDQPKQKR